MVKKWGNSAAVRIPAAVLMLLLAVACYLRAAPSRYTRHFDLPGLRREQAKYFRWAGAMLGRSLHLVRIGEGERIVAISCGGGGYGPPAARPPDRVAQDVADGLVSAERALAIYGVALASDSTVAAAATAAAREVMA